jgi:acyl-coenzyme A synthetase/AMP-(fatty) acid ligase
MDYQLKILGHRVELGEIEAVIRAASGVDGVVAVGWPVNASGADGIEVFLQTESVDAAALQEKVKSKLPVYMQPRHYRALARFPLNSNGKFDRKALLDILQTPK